MPEKDPRTDHHPGDGTPGSYPQAPQEKQPEKAPGGVGTGTKGDPAGAPGAQPKK